MVELLEHGVKHIVLKLIKCKYNIMKMVLIKLVLNLNLIYLLKEHYIILKLMNYMIMYKWIEV